MAEKTFARWLPNESEIPQVLWLLYQKITQL